MPHAVSAPSPGLQALILCGPGSSFPTFTANPDENPKALLPIANRPMVWYPIDFCYRMGVTDLTLICPPSALEAITTALNTNPHLTTLPHPRPNILAPADLDQNTGTAELLRLPEVRDAVTGDFLLLPCDLVCELPGEKLLQAWMVQAATMPDILGDYRSAPRRAPLPSGGLGVWYETRTDQPVKGEETDFIAVTPLPQAAIAPPKGSILAHVSKLVYSMPTDSLNDHMEARSGLPLRHGLIRSHPRIRMLTTHRDAHIYVLPRWILEFVRKNERLDSVGEDVIGWWAKAGWETGLAAKLGMAELFEQDKVDDLPPNVEVDDSLDGPQEKGETQPSTDRDQSRRTDSVDTTPSQMIPSIVAYIHPSGPTEPLIRRVDTTKLLLHVSLRLAKVPSIEEAGSETASPFAHARKVAYPEGVKPRTTITRPDTLIGENVTVQEKTSIKESVVGANCQINEGARLSQCLLMDGVVVGKSCKLTRCILGKRCVIGDNTTLTDCEVQENLLVEPGTDQKDEKLMSSEGLEATAEEIEEALQDEEGDPLDSGDAVDAGTEK